MRLPASVQAQMDALPLFRKPVPASVIEMEQRRRDVDAMADDDAKKAAQQAHQQAMSRLLARGASAQMLLRAL